MSARLKIAILSLLLVLPTASRLRATVRCALYRRCSPIGTPALRAAASERSASSRRVGSSPSAPTHNARPCPN